MKHRILNLIESIAISLQRFVDNQRFTDYQKRTARARQFNYARWKETMDRFDHDLALNNLINKSFDTESKQCGDTVVVRIPQNNFQNSPCGKQDKNL